MKHSYSTISAMHFISPKTDKKNCLIVDVRTPAEVDNEAYQPSINIPLDSLTINTLNAALESKNHRVAGNTSIFLLCGTGKRAENAALAIASEMPNDVYIVEGGISALKASGAIVEKGPGKIISLERQVRIAAGLLILVGVFLGFSVAPAFYGLSAFVGAGLVFAGITDNCGMALILAKMPWNRLQAL